jgi:Uncharacterized conserved protein
MQPTIDSTRFGEITIEGKTYELDVVISLNGEVRNRNKRLSSTQYGTSHIISLDEAHDVYQAGAALLVIGTGQTGYVELSKQANEYFKQHGCHVLLMPTPQAIETWNSIEEAAIGLFHVTC